MLFSITYSLIHNLSLTFLSMSSSHSLLKLCIYKKKNIKHFKNLLRSLKHYVDSYNILFTSELLEINTMNQQKISFLQIIMNAEFFDVYELSKSTVLGIYAETFSKCLRCCPNAVKLELEIYNNDPDTLRIHLESKQRSVQVSMSLIDLETESLEIPEIEYDSVIKMPVKTLLNTIHDFEMLDCETILLETYSKHLKIEGRNDTAKVTMTLKEENEEDIHIQLRDEVCITISLMEFTSFIKNILRLQSDSMILQLTNGRPLNLSFQICEHFTLQYYLAPKENPDDEELEEADSMIQSIVESDSEATEESDDDGEESQSSDY